MSIIPNTVPPLSRAQSSKIFNAKIDELKILMRDRSVTKEEFSRKVEELNAFFRYVVQCNAT